jgi:membrane protein
MKQKLLKFKELMIQNDIYKNIKKILTLNGLSLFAPAALSFYMIISFIPCILLIEFFLTVINIIFGRDFSFLLYFFTTNIEVINSIKEILFNITTGSIISLFISLIVIIYLASKGLSFFTKIVRNIWGVQHEKSNFMIEIITYLLSTIVLIFIFAFFIVFLIIFDNVLSFLPDVLTFIINYFLTMLVIFIFTTFLYHFITKKGMKKDHMIGSIFSTLGISIGIIIYYLYLTNISKTLSYYGPLSSISMLCLIFFYSSYILFIGAEINLFIYKKAQKNR